MLKRQKIKLIVFDIGGTVFSKGKESFINLLAKRLHISKSRAKHAVDGSHGLAYRRNQIPAKKYWAKVKAELKLSQTDEYLANLWFKQYTPIKGMPQLVKKLRNKYKVAYLSNNIPERVKYLQKKYDFLDWFDDGIFSYEVKSVKSDGGLYKELLQKFTPILPEEILLIDDKMANLEKPKKMGCCVLVFFTISKLTKDLKTKGILW